MGRLFQAESAIEKVIGRSVVTILTPASERRNAMPYDLTNNTGSAGENHTRERRRPALRVYFIGRRFGSIFVRPVPLFTSMI